MTKGSNIYGVEDDETQMTLGRLIARKLSKTTTWYNPSKNLNPVAKMKAGMPLDGSDTVPPPSLDEAWEFYEHQMLPRRFIDGDEKRAEPGESKEPTKLYDIFETSLDDMGAFGIGVGTCRIFHELEPIYCVTGLILGFGNPRSILQYCEILWIYVFHRWVYQYSKSHLLFK